MGFKQVSASTFLEYWKPEPGAEYVLDLVGNRTITTDFGGTEEEQELLEIDIIKVDFVEFDTPLKFASKAVSFCKDIIPIINFWEKAGAERIRVLLKYNINKRYTVEDKTDELANKRHVQKALSSRRRKK